jgi:transposase
MNMKALAVTNQAVTREGLLHLAEKVPGAWTGIRIAALLLMLDGLTSTRVAELFGISRWSMVKWIQRVNGEGLSGVEEKPKPGRPARFDTGVRKNLEKALQRSPRKFGLKRNRWNGIVVVEYLERVHGVHLKVRQAQRWIRRLGFSLRQPIYRYAQATKEGVEEFRETIKKTPGRPEKRRKKDAAVFG